MSKALQAWNRTERLIVGVLAVCATLLSFYAVIMRYFFRDPPDWAEEVVIYMIIWAVFITASTLAEEKGHVAATLLVERFSLGTRRLLAVFNGLLAIGFCVLVSIYGYRIVGAAYVNDERSLTALRVHLWIPYLSVALGCSLVTLRYALRVYRLVYRFTPSEIMETHELSREEKPS